MKRILAIALFFATPSMALDAASTGADWVRATSQERALWGTRLARNSGDDDLALATIRCIDAATNGAGGLRGQNLAELAAVCMTMLEGEREGRKKMARDRTIGPAASPENKSALAQKMPRAGKIIGVWISNRSNVTSRIVIYERDGKVWMEYGGPGGESELLRKKQAEKTLFRDKDQHPSDKAANLHWIMKEDGALEWHGDGGLQETIVLVKK